MAQMYPALADKHTQFIAAQKMFFVGTATADSRINVSPKGLDALRVLDPQRVAWLNVTGSGSGNETSAHVQADARQIFDLAIDNMQTSCGMGVPLYDYKGERGQLEAWAEKKGETGLRDYWTQKNQASIDGLPTHILDRNG